MTCMSKDTNYTAVSAEAIPVSAARIRERIVKSKTRYHVNDNISVHRTG